MKKQVFNVAALTAGDAGARFVGFLATVYLARILAPSAFGLISIGLALLGQLSLLSSPGIQVIEARNVAAGPGGSRDRVGMVLGMRLVLAVTLLGITTAVLFLLPAFAPIRFLLAFFTASLIPMGSMVDWYFQGKENGLLVGGGRFLQSAIYALCLLLLVHSAGDLLYVPVALFIGNGVAALTIFVGFLSAEGMPRLRWDPAGWWGVFHDNMHVGLAVAIGQLMINYPPIAIGWILSTVDAGLWGAAMKLVFFVLMLDRVLSVALLPPMTRVLTRKQGNEQEFVTLIFRIVAGGILPVAFLGAVLSPTAILLIFGGDYQGAAWMLSALMIYVVLTLVNSVFTCALIGGGQERLYSVRMIMGSIGMVVLVTILTLGGGVPGTVIGVVIGEMAIVGLMISAVAGKLGLRISPVQPDLLVGAIVLLAAYLLLQDPVFQVPVGVGVYALVLIAFRSFPVAELRDLRRRLA